MKHPIRLRPAIDSDSNVLWEWINNRDLVEYSSPFREISKVEHEKWFANIRIRKDTSFFMIENAQTGLTIGSCKLFNIDPIHRSAELQIRIGVQDFQNQGAGSESVLQLIRHGFVALNLNRISLHVFANNLRAIRVYEKNGFSRERVIRHAVQINNCWLDLVYMARVRGLDE